MNIKRKFQRNSRRLRNDRLLLLAAGYLLNTIYPSKVPRWFLVASTTTGDHTKTTKTLNIQKSFRQSKDYATGYFLKSYKHKQRTWSKRPIKYVL